ncbi:MAG: hypothetical protein QOH79_696 [Acidimicrobiaceae bacterium]
MRIALAVALLAGLVFAPPADAAAPPSGFSSTSIGGLSGPTAMAMAPDGRLFITQQGGAVRVVKDGALLPTPFVQLTVDSTGERGLLGITFDPSFVTNHFVYLYYTVPSPAHNRVSRFVANGDVATPGSEVVILDLNNLSTSPTHNGGALHFGPDGKLYVAVGDNANGAQAQTLTQPFGKILRLNPNGSAPTDNPFFDGGGANYDWIWAYGLRNPFTFTFQPGTGRLFANDVGQFTWEEVDDVVPGDNYGWPSREGFCAANSTDDCGPPPVGMTNPVYAFSHTEGCAIVGGAFYNIPDDAPEPFPASFNGDYVFSDLCSGWLRTLDAPAYDSATDFLARDTSTNPVDLLVSPDGSLWYLSRGTNAVVHVRYFAPTWNPVEVVRPDGVLDSGPAVAAVRGADRIDSFVRGTDGAVYWTSLQGGGASAWTSLGAPAPGAIGEPAAASMAPGRLDVFVRGADGRLWQRFSTTGGSSWSAWFQAVPDGVLASSPAVVSWMNDRLDVTVTGTDGQIWQRFWDGSSWNAAWLPLGEPPTGSVVGAPAEASWSPGRLDVFVRGTDDRLWQTFWEGSSWSAWIRPPGTETGLLTASPAAASWGFGEETVAVRGVGGGIYATSFVDGPPWTDWERLGEPSEVGVGPPGATSTGSGQIHVFVRGTDDLLYRFSSPL